MKLLKSVLSSLIIVALVLPGVSAEAAVAKANLKVEKVSYPVVVNMKVINQNNKKYPYLVYNKVPYLPLSKEDKALLGLKTTWSAKTNKIFVGLPKQGFNIFKASDNYQAILGKTPVQKASKNNSRLFLGSVEVTKTLKSPLLRYNGITYLPLDQHTAKNAGWYYHFDAKHGVVLTTNNVPAVMKKSQLGVYKKEVFVYKNPTTKANVLGIAQAGQIYQYTVAGKGWYKIALEGNKYGYLQADGVDVDLSDNKKVVNNKATIKAPRKAVSMPKAPEKVTIKEAPKASEDKLDINTVNKRLEISADMVNLRNGPGTTYDIVGRAIKGESIKVVGEADNWYKLDKEGSTMWVASWLTASEGSLAKEKSQVSEKTEAPKVSSPVSTSKGKSVVSYRSRESQRGQGTVSLDIGDSQVRVDRGSDGQLVLRVRNATVGNLGALANNLAPFASFSVTSAGNDVLIEATINGSGYFRLSQNNSKFDVTAVKKHKNGQVGLAGKVIVIDPGHGSYEANGMDYGASGKSGITEYKVVTPISMKLKEKLEASGAKVILTRGEAFKKISLAERAYVANDNNADVFISIHADSFVKDSSVRGSKVFYYDGNARLTTQVQSGVRKALANALANQIRGVSGRAQVNFANFAVNRENKVPSVLVETGFLSNPEEEALLATDEYQNQMAQAMYDGLAAYFAY